MKPGSCAETGFPMKNFDGTHLVRTSDDGINVGHLWKCLELYLS